MADQDILQAIKIIDDKIASLQAARNQLAHAFGIDSKSSMPPVNATSAAVAAIARASAGPQRIVPNANSNGTSAHEPTGRKVELAKFLALRGPTARATIIGESGLPEGTISYCLNDKRFFEQGPDGNWAITEYSRRGLERGFGPIHAEAH
jgi:hypothetical protein